VLDHGSLSRFDFMSLPFELRDRIYRFAAMSCSDVEPLKLRSTLKVKGRSQSRVCRLLCSPPWSLPQVTSTVVHRHTLHNMMLMNRNINAEAKSSLYRYVPIHISLGYMPIQHALDITPCKVPKDDKLLAELAQCKVLILAEDFSLDRTPSQPSAAGYMTKFLDWFKPSESLQAPLAQLHIRILDYIKESKVDQMANTILRWLDKHERKGDYLERSVRFILHDTRGNEADFRLCSTSCPPGSSRSSYDHRKRQVAQVRRLCRRYPHLVISNIDWTTMEEKPVNQEGLEIVTGRQYIPRVGPRLLAAQARQAAGD